MKKQSTFLLIDDDADDRELFEMALENVAADAQINFIGAASCGEALGFLKNGAIAPDFIFLDLNMPEMNGRECLVELKRTIHLTQIPVIIFSTSSDPLDIKETAALGAVDFITKPSKISELSRIIGRFLSK